MESKVALEVAEQEFSRFVELMDLDVETSGMDEEDRKSFEQQKHRILVAIQAGALIINEAGEPVYTPQRSSGTGPITFYEPTGASLMAMDRRKKGEDVSKLYAIMSDITKTHVSTFAKMRIADLKVCQAVLTFFLA